MIVYENSKGISSNQISSTYTESRNHVFDGKTFQPNFKLSSNLNLGPEIQLKSNPSLGITYHSQLDKINLYTDYVILSSNAYRNHTSLIYKSSIILSCLGWLEIGLGCLIVNVRFDEADLVKELNDLLYQTLLDLDRKLIQDNLTSKIIFLTLTTQLETSIVQLTQISRIFAGNFLKESVSEAEFLKLSTVKLITSDADLIPLSPKFYFDFYKQFYFVNPMNNFYSALSCISSSIGNWYQISHILDEFQQLPWNASKIIDFAQQQKPKILKMAPKGKIDWYLDQLLLSFLLKNFVETQKIDLKEFRYRNKYENINADRIDRTSLFELSFVNKVKINHTRVKATHYGIFYNQVNENQFIKKYRDAHLCKSFIYNYDCFWANVAVLNSAGVESSMIDIFKKFRENLILMAHRLHISESNQIYFKTDEIKGIENNLALNSSIDSFNLDQNFNQLYPKVYISGYQPTGLDLTNNLLISRRHLVSSRPGPENLLLVPKLKPRSKLNINVSKNTSKLSLTTISNQLSNDFLEKFCKPKEYICEVVWEKN